MRLSSTYLIDIERRDTSRALDDLADVLSNCLEDAEVTRSMTARRVVGQEKLFLSTLEVVTDYCHVLFFPLDIGNVNVVLDPIKKWWAHDLGIKGMVPIHVPHRDVRESAFGVVATGDGEQSTERRRGTPYMCVWTGDVQEIMIQTGDVLDLMGPVRDRDLSQSSSSNGIAALIDVDGSSATEISSLSSTVIHDTELASSSPGTILSVITVAESERLKSRNLRTARKAVDAIIDTVSRSQGALEKMVGDPISCSLEAILLPSIPRVRAFVEARTGPIPPVPFALYVSGPDGNLSPLDMDDLDDELMKVVQTRLDYIAPDFADTILARFDLGVPLRETKEAPVEASPRPQHEHDCEATITSLKETVDRAQRSYHDALKRQTIMFREMEQLRDRLSELEQRQPEDISSTVPDPDASPTVTSDEADPDSPYDPTDALLIAKDRFPNLVIMESAVESSEELRATAKRKVWGRDSYIILKSMDSYVEWVKEGNRGNYKSYLDSLDIKPFSLHRLKTGESETTKGDSGSLAERTLPVPTWYRESGRAVYLNHVRVESSGKPPAPRLYFIDASREAHPCMIIGYLGEHLRNSSTN